MKLSVYMIILPLLLNYVATLPCEIRRFKVTAKLNSKHSK